MHIVKVATEPGSLRWYVRQNPYTTWTYIADLEGIQQSTVGERVYFYSDSAGTDGSVGPASKLQLDIRT